jgi:hypothetical protein
VLAAAGFCRSEEVLGRDRPASDSLNERLPEWVRLNGEYRLRLEGFAGLRFQPGVDDFYALNRVRLGLRLQPSTYFRVFVEAQDARVFGNSRISATPPYQDSVDLRQAWVEFGDPDKRKVTLRVGRQELSFGEQRLVGPSNWSNTARTFDTVKLTLRVTGVRMHVFAASVVATREGEFDRHVDGDNLHGASAEISKLIPRANLEPYVFWRLAPRVRGENGSFGKLDTKTAGFRWTGEFGSSFDYAIEMVGQGGHQSNDPLRSWAGHWRLGYQTGQQKYAPKIRPEYDYASGDRNPLDGRHGTFEVLYPTPHDKYGLADQVGWKNIHHAGVMAEWKVARGWTVQAKHHLWWLASARDGLYSAGGALLVRDPTGASGNFVGREIDFQTQWNVAKQIFAAGGIGHIFPGEFLKNASPRGPYTWGYMMLTYSF